MFEERLKKLNQIIKEMLQTLTSTFYLSKDIQGKSRRGRTLDEISERTLTKLAKLKRITEMEVYTRIVLERLNFNESSVFAFYHVAYLHFYI